MKTYYTSKHENNSILMSITKFNPDDVTSVFVFSPSSELSRSGSPSATDTLPVHKLNHLSNTILKCLKVRKY